MVEIGFEDARGRSIRFVRTSQALIIEYEDRRIGYCAVRPVARPAQPGKSTHGFQLTEIQLDADFCRVGIGSAALACCRDWYEPLDIPRDEQALAQATAAYRGLIARAIRQGQFLNPWPTEVAHKRRRSDLDR